MKDKKIVEIFFKILYLRKKETVNVNVCACSLIEATFLFFFVLTKILEDFARVPIPYRVQRKNVIGTIQ
jgi:hypothetical protein